MKILIVSAATSWMRGGVPTETRDLVAGLHRLGHQIALGCDVPLPGAEVARHFPIALPVGRSSAEQLRQAIETFRPDFVHVLCMGAKGLVALLPVLQSTRWALTVHSLPPAEQKLRRWHDREALHYFARAIRFLPNSLGWRWLFRGDTIPKVIVHSRFVHDMVARFGLPKERMTVVPLPFHAQAGAAPAGRGPRTSRTDSPRLVTVGGIAHTKGQHDVIKALPQLVKRFPGLTYQVIGEIRDEAYVAWLERLAGELGVASHVSITPDLPNDDKIAALAAADVYVQPSHEEGFCLAYAEAAAVVDRLVGADAGAIAAMSLDDPGARVVPPRSPDAIAQAVVDLLDSALPEGHMATRVARLGERFSYDSYLRHHEALYAG
ncbi:MAG TPA: glycosyltransferase family 4 protein [Caldimonas sp.]|nr:glycosyltransferase family 4 protein [Caldimonas sp.]